MIKSLTFLLIGLLAVLCLSSLATAADVTLKWDPVTGATGYKVYQSVDNGTTWSAATDVGNVTQRVFTGVSETTMVLFRVGAYNATGDAVRFEAGAWYDFRKKPPGAPSGAGIQ